MATYIQIGDRIDYKNATGTAIKAGDVVELGTNRIARLSLGSWALWRSPACGSFRQTTALPLNLARLPTGMQQAKR